MQAPPASRYWCFGLVAGGCLACDLVSKWWVFAALGGPGHSSRPLLRFNLLWGRFEFRLTTLLNQGALFGLGQGFGWLFAILSLIAAGGILYWLFVRAECSSWWLTVTLGLIFAGALGNLYDRLHLHGWKTPEGKSGVRDFLDCTIPGIQWAGLRPRLIREYPWPVFNFADVCLVTGSIMLALHSIRTPRKEPPGEPAAK
jgi:signal peptidase II